MNKTVLFSIIGAVVVTLGVVAFFLTRGAANSGPTWPFLEKFGDNYHCHGHWFEPGPTRKMELQVEMDATRMPGYFYMWIKQGMISEGADFEYETDGKKWTFTDINANQTKTGTNNDGEHHRVLQQIFSLTNGMAYAADAEMRRIEPNAQFKILSSEEKEPAFNVNGEAYDMVGHAQDNHVFLRIVGTFGYAELNFTYDEVKGPAARPKSTHLGQ